MPSYGDDQCLQCGGIRVAGSNLCLDCMVKEINRERERRLNMVCEIEGLQELNKRLNNRLENAVAYGFKQNRVNMQLSRHIKGLENKVREVMEDGKNRV